MGDVRLKMDIGWFAENNGAGLLKKLCVVWCDMRTWNTFLNILGRPGKQMLMGKLGQVAAYG